MPWLTVGRLATEGSMSSRYHTAADRGKVWPHSRGPPASAEGGAWA